MVGIADNGAQILESYLGSTGAKPSWWVQLINLENKRDLNEFWDWDVAPGALGLPPLSAPTPDVVTPVPTILYAPHDGEIHEMAGTDTFYEDVHVYPKEHDLGFVSQNTSVQIEVFNAYRRTPQTLNSWTNNDGPGIDISGLPTLPHEYEAFNGSGLDVFLDISSIGDPIVDTTIDFTWASVGIDVVSLVFSRLVPLATNVGGLLLPEDEYTEDLRFLTDILEKSNGKEQRIRTRKRPRQIFAHTYRTVDELERAELDILLVNTQGQYFAEPIWYEQTPLTAAVAVGDTVLSVQDADSGDFRSLSAVAIFVEGGDWEMRGVASLTSTSLTLSSGTTHAYPAGAYVVPVRAARITPSIGGGRYQVNVADLELYFETRDNDIDIADVSAFSSYNGKVLLDDGNFIKGTKPVSIVRRIVAFDGLVGGIETASPWLQARMTTEKVFVIKTRAALWTVRQLLHALGGRWKSFYLPTFRHDLTITQTVLAGGDRIFVNACGYTAHALALPRWDVIRITLYDGTQFIREIIDAVEIVGGTEEQLTINAPLYTLLQGIDVTPEEISIVEFIEKVRFDSDTIQIQYRRGSRAAQISAPVKVVLE